MLKKFFFSLIICIVVLLAIIWYVQPPSAVTHGNSKITILCTTSMIADAAKIIGGEHVQVHALMGPGIDPHLYKAREHDAHRLHDAEIIFYNGLHLEGKIAHILEQCGSYKTSIALGNALDKQQLIACDEHHYDPHIWHDVQLWITVVDAIKNTLATYDTEHAHEYEHNAISYIQQLLDLDASIKEQLQLIPFEKRILITAHDAFSYFGAAYGMQVIGLQGISTEGEIGIHDIQNLVDFLIDKNITTIFIESAVSPRALHAVQAAAQARGFTIALGQELYSDALGDTQSKADTYIAMIQHNVHALVSGLS